MAEGKRLHTGTLNLPAKIPDKEREQEYRRKKRRERDEPKLEPAVALDVDGSLGERLGGNTVIFEAVGERCLGLFFRFLFDFVRVYDIEVVAVYLDAFDQARVDVGGDLRKRYLLRSF